ncbi:hypothetical protein Bbelb_008050 [Branchiostoma belcheri]|nr:hypothetical protein Bbelb_008050 [Branchiostoma belcheri]
MTSQKISMATCSHGDDNLLPFPRISPLEVCVAVAVGWPRAGTVRLAAVHGESVTCIPTKMAGWVKVVKLERPGGTGIYGFSVIGGPGTEVPLCIGAVIEGSPADYSRQGPTKHGMWGGGRSQRERSTSEPVIHSGRFDPPCSRRNLPPDLPGFQVVGYRGFLQMKAISHPAAWPWLFIDFLGVRDGRSMWPLG